MTKLAGIVREAGKPRGEFLAPRQAKRALPKGLAGKILRREIRPRAEDSA
jgi:hypothetical protein